VLFVETPVFTNLVRRALDDDDYRALQITLLLRPEQGDLTATQTRELARLVREEFQ
jgi:hypothetical protein